MIVYVRSRCSSRHGMWLTHCSVTNLTFSDGKKSIRQQFYYDVKGDDHCGSGYIVRVRSYIAGDMEGLKYVDMKYSNHFEHLACAAPIGPSPSSPLNIFNTSAYTMKCEHGT